MAELKVEIKENNNRYDKPFCIIGSKGKFHESYRYYLPPLELPEETKGQDADNKYKTN